MGNGFGMASIVTNGDVDFVRMNDGMFSTTNLYTQSLYGCYGLVAASSNGRTKSGIMTHYDPTNERGNIERIKKLCTAHPEFAEGTIKGKLFLPELFMGNSGRFIKMICKAMGGDVNIQPVGYYWHSCDVETERFLAREYQAFGKLLLQVQEGEYTFMPRVERGHNPDYHGFLY